MCAQIPPTRRAHIAQSSAGAMMIASVARTRPTRPPRRPGGRRRTCRAPREPARPTTMAIARRPRAVSFAGAVWAPQAKRPTRPESMCSRAPTCVRPIKSGRRQLASPGQPRAAQSSPELPGAAQSCSDLPDLADTTGRPAPTTALAAPAIADRPLVNGMDVKFIFPLIPPPSSAARPLASHDRPLGRRLAAVGRREPAADASC